jgi:hypothetical protein
MSFRRMCSIVTALCMTALAVPTVGCGSKSESQPNPEFTAPELPAGRQGGPPGVGGKKAPDNKDGKKG